MASNDKPFPEGSHSITPYLVVKGGAAAIDFYKAAFGATELFRMPEPDGRVGHAELRIGDSVIMLADELPEMKIVGPKTLGGTTVGILLHVADADAIFSQAVSLGSKVMKPLANLVLRRPQRNAGRSIWPQVDHLASRRGRFSGRDEAARGREQKIRDKGAQS